jgi:pyruvate/2-oxoglutarate dehydrogenase complex dihydrolipoamide dehydrogenase (E3) component
MAQAFNRLGSKVVILERGERILSKERPEISEILSEQLLKEGIEIITNHDLKSFKDEQTAIIENRTDNSGKELSFDATLLAIGRGLNHASLDVEAAGIKETDRKRIVVNDYLQTNQSHIYVVGDAAGMYQFSHGAEKHVNLLEYNFTSLLKRKHSVKGLSWVTFTDPEIASFGFTESYLQENNIKYWRQDQAFNHDDRAITAGYEYGRITLFVSTERNKSRRRIYGGSIIAPNAGEIMQELHLASLSDICLSDFMEKVYAYPTASRINQQTIMGIVNS